MLVRRRQTGRGLRSGVGLEAGPQDGLGSVAAGEADISTGPTSVSTAFARVPLRLFPPFFPAGSCLS
ncbi:hypothetical protein ADK52_20255 [Streptomyces sp. WM6372]|nr:hypothetical protein ADK52_20255 [Streptomyces sp. WM6372]